jgi:molybdate transport system substrate-binding protein
MVIWRVVTAALLALLSFQAPAPPPLTVAAAISLTDALEEIARAYAAAGGGQVRFNFAGSNVLARQIINGAPADLFISADEEQMNVVEKANGLVAGSRVNLLANALSIVALPERAAFVREQFARAPAEIRRLAIGDPAAVPAGVYARQYLEKQGLWKAYESRIVPTTNVRASLTAVETGAADAAIVYVTDAATAKNAVAALVIPADKGPRIVYPAAALTSSPNRSEAERFLKFLRSRQASAIFIRYKFQPLEVRE